MKKCTLSLNNICFDLSICKGKLEYIKRIYYSNRQGVQMSFGKFLKKKKVSMYV